MLSERLFEDILVKYPELVEERLTFLGRQVSHFGKRIDILFEDRFKEKLIVELKKDNLDRNALSQVMEYEGYILSEKDPTTRVMIIANRIPLNLKKAMDHHGIEYKEITYKCLHEFLEKRDKLLLEQMMDRNKENSQTIAELTSKKKVDNQHGSYPSNIEKQGVLDGFNLNESQMGVYSRRGRIIELLKLNKSDEEILDVINKEFPPGVFSSSNKRAIYGTKRDLRLKN